MEDHTEPLTSQAWVWHTSLSLLFQGSDFSGWRGSEKMSLIISPRGEKMGFHEHILSTTTLLIVVQAFIFISKIMEKSLQNCQDLCLKAFDFQSDMFIPVSFCPFLPLTPAKFWGTCLLLDLDNNVDLGGPRSQSSISLHWGEKNQMYSPNIQLLRRKKYSDSNIRIAKKQRGNDNQQVRRLATEKCCLHFIRKWSATQE